MQSVLDHVKGIGPQSCRKLLTTFGSAERVFSAEPDQLVAVIGSAKAALIIGYRSNAGPEQGKITGSDS
jgi:excinuclease UvrABC nuclease subunit